jgi:hypothetical protein
LVAVALGFLVAALALRRRRVAVVGAAPLDAASTAKREYGTDPTSITNNANSANRAVLVRAGAHVGPLTALPPGTGSGAVADEAKDEH